MKKSHRCLQYNAFGLMYKVTGTYTTSLKLAALIFACVISGLSVVTV